MIPILLMITRACGTLFVIMFLLRSMIKVLDGSGEPSEIIGSLVTGLIVIGISFAAQSVLESIMGISEPPASSHSPLDSLNLKAIVIGLGITIIMIAAGFTIWHFSRPWRDKRASENVYKKGIREIWRLRSRIAEGAFDEQGLDMLTALAFVEDSLITFKVYKAEATLKEQLDLLKRIKPKLNDIGKRYGNAWKNTVIENALDSITITGK
jgi:hypothetical protein